MSDVCVPGKRAHLKGKYVRVGIDRVNALGPKDRRQCELVISEAAGNPFENALRDPSRPHLVVSSYAPISGPYAHMLQEPGSLCSNEFNLADVAFPPLFIGLAQQTLMLFECMYHWRSS